MSHTLVLGIGNSLLSDEGVGIHVIRHLQHHYPQDCNITYLDGGTLSFTLAADLETADNLIVIDAAQLQAPPGTIQVFIDDAMDSFLGKAKRSVHEVGLLDLMDIARLTDTLPLNRALIGIQPEFINWGENPSPAVEASIEPAAKKALDLIAQWRQASPAPDANMNQQASPQEQVS